MANIVLTNAYQINQRPPIPLADVTQVGFPTASTVIGSCFNSPTRYLSTGVNVYSFAITPDGNKYYLQQTVSALATLFNA